MPATTATYTSTTTVLGAEQYRAQITVTATTNALELELFVFDTVTDAYAGVATHYALEVYPNNKTAAINGGLPFYRAAAVLRDYPRPNGAADFLAETATRITALCRGIDAIAVPFSGTETGTLPA